MRPRPHTSPQPNTASPARLPIEGECLLWVGPSVVLSRSRPIPRISFSDMWCTGKYVQRMGVMVQIRNVPSEFHRELKSRPALEALSLSDYLPLVVIDAAAILEVLLQAPAAQRVSHTIFVSNETLPAPLRSSTRARLSTPARITSG